MEYLNAWETYTLYDSVMISGAVDTLYKSASWYADYAALAVPASIPFLNVRNAAGVGSPYNNFDSRDKMPYPFQVWSMGIDFNPQAVINGTSPDSSMSVAAALFANELPKHCGFIFKVSQDEKLVNTTMLMPSGQGVVGWADGMEETTGYPQLIQNVNQGDPARENRWKFAEPVCLPREVNISGELVFSEYGRQLLAKMLGPNDLVLQAADTDPYAGASIIRVSMYGKREVQQRNALHYSV